MRRARGRGHRGVRGAQLWPKKKASDIIFGPQLGIPDPPRPQTAYRLLKCRLQTARRPLADRSHMELVQRVPNSVSGSFTWWSPHICSYWYGSTISYGRFLHLQCGGRAAGGTGGSGGPSCGRRRKPVRSFLGHSWGSRTPLDRRPACRLLKGRLQTRFRNSERLALFL